MQFTWEPNDDDYDDGDWSKAPKTGRGDED